MPDAVVPYLRMSGCFVPFGPLVWLMHMIRLSFGCTGVQSVVVLDFWSVR